MDAKNKIAELTATQLRELAGRLGKRSAVKPLTAQVRGDRIALSFAQERLWFLEQLGLMGAAYNMPMVLRLEGRLHVEALERSFAELVRRHESLRTYFGESAGIPWQGIDEVGAFALERDELSGLEPPRREQTLKEWIQRERLHRFDLSRGGLMRVVLLRLGDREHVLLLTMHHIISDGWSMGVLIRELSVLYGQQVKGGRRAVLRRWECSTRIMRCGSGSGCRGR